MHDLQLEKNSSLVNKHHKTEQKKPQNKQNNKKKIK